MIISQMIALELLVGSGPAIVTTTSEQEDVVYRRVHTVDDQQITYWRNPNDTEQMP